MPSFEELGLSASVLAAVRAAGFEKPTSIQSLFIPKAVTGRDVMGQAKTGTGKTAAFLLPIFERLKPGQASPAVLILAPTRELAMQIHSEVVRLGGALGYSTITLYGGSSYEPQIEALAKGVDLVVGTPGRVMDHMRSQRLDLSKVKVTVLDEADRMLDLGFRRDIEYILRHCPPERQTLLLSATIPDDILKLAKRFMHDPEEVWTAPEKMTVDEVEQFFVSAERDEKFHALLKLLDTERPSLAIIFCATKLGAKKLAGKLQNLKLNAREIHGDLVQKKREKIMGHFRAGKVQLLIATDVASRGIDVLNISHIINYDIPFKCEDYVHRIGRTGRMNRAGKAFTFVTREEGLYLTQIEMFINREIHSVQFDSLESIFWPNPPSVMPPEFAGGDSETAVSEEDYLSPQEPKHGPSRGRKREPGSERGRSPRGGTGAVSKSTSGRRRNRGQDVVPVEITCSTCGVKTAVRFKPDPKRPVYCDACYASRKAVRDGHSLQPQSSGTPA